MPVEEAVGRLTIIEGMVSLGQWTRADLAYAEFARDAMRSFVRQITVAEFRQVSHIAYLVMAAHDLVYAVNMRRSHGRSIGQVQRTTVRIIGTDDAPREVVPVGIREIAARFGVSPAAVSNRINRDPAFPSPFLRVQAGPVYDLTAIERYWGESD